MPKLLPLSIGFVTIALLFFTHFSPVKAQSPNTYLYLNGNVGIGTTSPGTYALNVVGTNNQIIKATTTSTSYASYDLVNDKGTLWQLVSGGSAGGGPGTDKFSIWYGGGRLTIDTAGNVGIGTTSPGAKLEIAGTVDATDNTLMRFNKGGNGTTDIIGHYNGGGDAGIEIGRAGFTPALYANVYNNTVGIGTATPNNSAMLDAQSSTKTYGIIAAGNTWGVYGTAANGGIYGVSNWGGGTGVRGDNTAGGYGVSGQSSYVGIYGLNTVSSCWGYIGTAMYSFVSGNCSSQIASSKITKENYTGVDDKEILTKIDQLPVMEWTYKATPGPIHIGPFAEDFHDIFGLNGSDDKSIGIQDEMGISLVGIKALSQEVKNQQREINELKQAVQKLKNQK